MKTIFKILYIFIFILTFIINIKSQQLPFRSHLSRFDFKYNPALTAVANTFEIGTYHRKQWLDFDAAPSTSIVYLQYPFVFKSMSIGASLEHEELGAFQRNELYLSYNYKLTKGYDSQLTIGLSTSINHLYFNSSSIVSNDSDDILIPNNNKHGFSSNFGFGFFYVSNKDMYDLPENSYYIGIGTKQILNKNLELSDQIYFSHNKLYLNALIGGRIYFSDLYFEPSIWGDYSFDNYFLATSSLKFELIDKFWAGILLASNYSFGFQTGIIISNGIVKEGNLNIGFLGIYNNNFSSLKNRLELEFIISYGLVR